MNRTDPLLAIVMELQQHRIQRAEDLEALARVPKAGGRVLSPKIDTPVGSQAVILDSEGNRIALHAY